MEPIKEGIKRFGAGRLMAILGVAAGVAAVLAAMILHVGSEPQSLLYSNLDLKEASEITAQLDQSGIKYEAKGDGSTIMVNREEVAKARLMLSSKGLPSSGSVGYEIFDQAPSLGQTEFVQNLNNQRALEGELARDIRTVRGISSARVRLVMPKRELFSDEAAAPTASVIVGLSGTGLTPDQVNTIRHYVASAVPNLKPTSITIVDDRNRLLAAGGDENGELSSMGAQRRTEIEETLRKRVKDIVEGVVGIGAARVVVTADIDLTSATKEEVKYDPDGQVVRSTGTSEAKDTSSDPNSNGGVSAASNIPGGAATPGVSSTGNQSNQTQETTNFEISSTKTTTLTPAGNVKKLSVSVSVDDIVTPSKDGKAPDTYAKRSEADRQKIEDLVKAAIGFDEARGDKVEVVNVRFNHAVGDTLGGTQSKPPMFDFTKNDIMRAIEMLILFIVAILIIFFVARPMLKSIATGSVMIAGPGGVAVAGPMGQAALGVSAGGQLGSVESTASIPYVDTDPRIDIARIEGQVKASSVKKVSEFVERHPDESVSILRAWLHDN